MEAEGEGKRAEELAGCAPFGRGWDSDDVGVALDSSALSCELLDVGCDERGFRRLRLTGALDVELMVNWYVGARMCQITVAFFG